MAAPMLRSVIPVAVAPIILVNEYSPGRLVGKLEMESVRSAQEYRLEGPGWARRTVARGSLFLQCRDCLSISGVVTWNRGSLLVMGIGFLGGLSSLWSPWGLSMIGTIIPTVCGSSSQQMNISKPGLLALHGLGYVIGAIAAGAALGMVGQLIVILFAAKPTGVLFSQQ